MLNKKNIVIFSSGNGTNAQAIIRHFKDSAIAQVSLVVSNKGDAPVLIKASQSGVPIMILDKKEYFAAHELVEFLKKEKTDVIVLAGFMLLIPASLTNAFPNNIVNIHPALLPAYGGKGMYGQYVHGAVIKNKEKESGITIHYVNEKYDEGKIILQEKCKIEPGDTPEILAGKIHVLEHKYYPITIERLLAEK